MSIIPYHSVSLRIIDLKTEFLNNFVSLTPQRINRIIFTRVCLFNYTAFFKKNKYKRHPRYKESKPTGTSNVAVLQHFGVRNQSNER